MLSVIIPVYNNRAYLRAAVQSALDHGVDDQEIIVVDDGSTDDSLDTVADLPVKTIRLTQNRGGAHAQNRGLEEARGSLITFLDSDDLFVSNGLQWRVDYLHQHAHVKAVGGRPAGVIDEAGKPCPQFKHLLHPAYKAPKVLDLTFFQSGGLYPVNSWLYVFRASVFKQIGMFHEDFKIAYDCDLMMRLLEHETIPIVFEPVVLRRIHLHNISLMQSKTGFLLNAPTQKEVNQILDRYQVSTRNMHPWENSYGLDKA